MAPPELIPLEILFGNPTNVGPRLSPDGKRISYLAPDEGIMNVWVRTVGQKDDRPVTHDRGSGVYIHLWSEDGRYLLYMQDKEGDENFHLFAVDIETGEERNLTPFPNIQARPIETHPKFPNEVLLVMNRRDPRLFDVFRVDLTTGKMTPEAENPGNIDEWLVDDTFRVRGAWFTVPGGFEFRVREGKDAWRTVARFGGDDDSSHPRGYTPDGKGLYLLDTRDHDTRRLVELDIETGAVKNLVSDPEYDVDRVVLNPATFQAEAVAIQAERLKWQAVVPEIQPVLDALMGIHEGELGGFTRDHNGDLWLAGYQTDDGPVHYYLWDRRTGEATFLFHHRPELVEYRLAKMEPIALKARDGLPLHGYMTLPPGEPAKNLPLVLNVHGGPFHRDTWGFHPEAQWFANRGYATLQINFRGSTGYGKRFLNAGNREWGGKMHDDLIDAVEWAVAQGIADPKRMAIYGWSYGGYAALAGAAFTPDAFRCSVAAVGPSNLVTFMRTLPPYWETFKEFLYKRVGHPEQDAEFLKSRSPLFQADRIKIPMLIAQGANDPRVKQAESEQIVEALRKKGHPVEYLLFQDEGHGFMKPENRLKFYRMAEAFLAEHLGGRKEETATPSG
ncbi:MAG: S9 family peptidase [Planctomycetota bacterium]|jgi:dipeptidyl aminopeptidase/acylaminoacyl peptidase